MGAFLKSLFSFLAKSGKGSFNWLGKGFKGAFDKFVSYLSDAFRWGFNNLKSWLAPVLKTLGFGAVGVEGVSYFTDAWRGVNEQFGAIASFFKLDELLASIANVIDPHLTGYTNASFIQIFSRMGGVQALNLFLDNAAIAIGVMIAILLLQLFASIVKTIVDVVT